MGRKRRANNGETKSMESDKMNELTIGITTFLRDDILLKCIHHLFEKVEIPFSLHIADQGTTTSKKEKFYIDLRRRKDCRVSMLPFDIGFGACQKFLFEECTTPFYIQLCDDEFPRKGSLSLMLRLIKELAPLKVGIVAPVLWENRRYRYLTKRYWIEKYCIETKILHVENICNFCIEFSGVEFETSPSGIPYVKTNYTAECGIIDTRVRERVNWDSNFKVDRSHIDFFLQLSRTDWKAVTTPIAVFDHYPEEKGIYKTYKRGTQRRANDIQYLERKWNIKEK